MKKHFNFVIIIFFLFFITCRENITSPEFPESLEISFLGGFIHANLMPAVPPDPIISEIELLVKNNSVFESISGITIPSAEVFLDSNNQKLGKIEFISDWDGHLFPGEIDTIKLTKVTENFLPFDPPCGKNVYLIITAQNNLNKSKLIETDSLMFNCYY